MRILEGISNACLCREVNDPLRAMLGKHLGYALAVGEIYAGKLELRMPLKSSEPRLLEPDIVIRAQVVETDDSVPTRQECLDYYRWYRSP